MALVRQHCAVKFCSTVEGGVVLCGRASPGMSPMERLNVMSPAAQRLATKRFGVRRLTSSALQATYNTPSPRSLCGRTPPLPSSPSPRSPKKRLIGHKGMCPMTQRSSCESSPGASLTDNLLKLPRQRKTAADFF